MLTINIWPFKHFTVTAYHVLILYGKYKKDKPCDMAHNQGKFVIIHCISMLVRVMMVSSSLLQSAEHGNSLEHWEILMDMLLQSLYC